MATVLISMETRGPNLTVAQGFRAARLTVSADYYDWTYREKITHIYTFREFLRNLKCSRISPSLKRTALTE